MKNELSEKSKNREHASKIDKKTRGDDSENAPKLTRGAKILKALGWASWLTACYLFGSILVLALLFLVKFFAPHSLENLNENVLFNALLSAGIYLVTLILAIGLPYFFAKKRHQASRADLKNWLGVARRPKLRDIFSVLWYLLVFYGFLVILSIVLSLILPREIIQQEQTTQFSEHAKYAIWELILIGASLTILPALAEEMLFRGFLFAKLRKFLRFWPTTLVVSLLFALWHFQINVGIVTFVLSLFLCHFREKTGAIWSGVLLHFLMNFVAFAVRFLG